MKYLDKDVLKYIFNVPYCLDYAAMEANCYQPLQSRISVFAESKLGLV